MGSNNVGKSKKGASYKMDQSYTYPVSLTMSATLRLNIFLANNSFNTYDKVRQSLNFTVHIILFYGCGLEWFW
jgi:hypothetical protein